MCSNMIEIMGICLNDLCNKHLKEELGRWQLPLFYTLLAFMLRSLWEDDPPPTKNVIETWPKECNSHTRACPEMGESWYNLGIMMHGVHPHLDTSWISWWPSASHAATGCPAVWSSGSSLDTQLLQGCCRIATSQKWGSLVLGEAGSQPKKLSCFRSLLVNPGIVE